MFVPEMGQISNKIHKHISLNDLVFHNAFAKEYELKTERKLEKLRLNPFNYIKSLLFQNKKPSSVAGILFSMV